jgi:hypothetical protein
MVGKKQSANGQQKTVCLWSAKRAETKGKQNGPAGKKVCK